MQSSTSLTRLCSIQDDNLRGLLHGLYIGVSGILLKPVSGCFSLLSELSTGASGKIKAWGEDSHKRPPIGRIRPPRQFSAVSSDMGGESTIIHINWIFLGQWMHALSGLDVMS